MKNSNKIVGLCAITTTLLVGACALFSKGNPQTLFVHASEPSIELIDRLHPGYPICVCKTPMSITDNEKVLGFPKDFTMTITDIKVYNGAGYIVLYMGNVLTMPGLAKESNYLKEVYNG